MRTPAFFPPNACDFRRHCRAGPYLAGRFPGETPQTAQPGSRSKVIVRLGTPSPMVTDDYRGLPKGSVRPGSEWLFASGAGAKLRGTIRDQITQTAPVILALLPCRLRLRAGCVPRTAGRHAA